MRFFNTYGPFETNPHLLPEIMKQLREGTLIKLGNITSKRDYIFVEDIANAIKLLSLSKRIGKCEILNIGTGLEYSAEEIVNNLSKLLQREISIKVDENKLRNSDKMHQIASLIRIKELINWKPQYDIQKGLQALLDYEQLVKSSELDKTGRVISRAIPIEILYKNKNLIVPFYKNSVSHSLWRSQEFSLFLNNKKLFKGPVLDFGCGDGSFTSVLFDRIDYGADIDKKALEIARDYNIYEKLVYISTDNSLLSIDSGTIGVVFSNSVLEHVVDLNTALSEIHRVLMPHGIFMFTVPVKQFARDLARYFGEKESIRINKLFYHRNLLEEEDWISLLGQVGFSIDSIIHYQPGWFTFFYKIFSISGIGRICNLTIHVFPWPLKRLIAGIVKKSINETLNGGNIFFITRKW
jgi:SAM-dependent methyltransferase